MMIMDAGVHVWRPQAPDRPWMPGRKAHLPEPLTYEKFGSACLQARRCVGRPLSFLSLVNPAREVSGDMPLVPVFLFRGRL